MSFIRRDIIQRKVSELKRKLEENIDHLVSYDKYQVFSSDLTLLRAVREWDLNETKMAEQKNK